MDSVSSYEAQLPAELGSVVAARRLVDSAMASWGMAGTVAEDAALVVSELVTNAVLHTGTVLSVRVRRLDRGVQLEVQDGSTQPPVAPPDRPEDPLATPSTTGRGLALLAATVDGWGTEPRPDGKVVWAAIGTGGRLPEGVDEPAPAGAPIGSVGSPRSTGEATVIATGAVSGRPVRLIGVPVRLLIESVQQFADLQRELQVVGLDHNGPQDLVDLAENNREIFARIGSLRQAGAGVVEAALARGEAVVDFDVDVADGALEAFDRLGSLMRRMDDTMGRRPLLSMPPSEEVTAFRRWYRDEISAQLRGRAPQPCPFTPTSA